MHIWTDLLAREAALLAVLMALGAGPASFLSGRFTAAGRIALAPALGFCLGTCVTTTLLEFFPAGDTYWVLIPLAIASVTVAVVRTPRGSWRSRLPLGDIAQLLVVCVAVAGPLTYTLHEHRTVGPVSYYFSDVDNFVAQQDAAQTKSIADARAAWTRHAATGRPIADLTQYQWAFLAHFDANLDATPLDANVNALLGLGATDTFSPFLIVLLLMGGLAAFAAVRYVTQSRTSAAVLAGALTGGAMFLELWFDSFQAAITALGLVIPFAIVAAECLRERRPANLGLLALLAGAFLSVYSLFIPMIVVTGAIVLAWRAWSIARSGESLRPLLKGAAISIGVVIVVAMAINLVGFTRDIHYYQAIARNQVPLPRVSFGLPVEVIPGWVLQTRELWNLTALSGEGKQLLLGALIPLALLALILAGLRRYRIALALVVLAAVCGVTAQYAFSSREACTYCAERDLLPLGPILIVLLGLGLAALFATRSRWGRIAGLLGLILLILAVGQRARVELHRFTDSSYFLDTANRSVLAHVPHDARGILLEGYGETTAAQSEQPLVYHLASERLPGRVSLSLGANLYNATEYLNFSNVESPGPTFDPAYDYVLTRLAGIATARTEVARSGPIALERRTEPLDVVTYSGIQVPLARLDPSGAAWVQTDLPLKMHVVGPTGGRVWAKLAFRAATPVQLAPQPGLRSRTAGAVLTVCVPASGSPPVREAAVQLIAAPLAGPVPKEEFPPAIPSDAVALTAMRAVAGHCVL